MKLGRDWLYDRGVRPGKEAQIVSSIIKTVSDTLFAEIEHGGCVDEFLRDQLVVYQALAEGLGRDVAQDGLLREFGLVVEMVAWAMHSPGAVTAAVLSMPVRTFTPVALLAAGMFALGQCIVKGVLRAYLRRSLRSRLIMRSLAGW